MEGGTLIFCIRYKHREEVVELSEYNTVGDLKLEIQRMFNVETTKQDIIGWSATPESDQYILRTCATDEFNNLVVTESISFDTDSDIRYSNTEAFAMDDRQTESIPISSDTDPDIRYSNTEVSAVDDDETDFVGLELKAIRRLRQHLPKDFPMKFHAMCFSDVLAFVRDLPEKKALLLYVHNSKDIFSRAFLKHLYNEELNSIIRNTCFVIGWDVEDNTLHNALIRVLNHNAKLSTMSHLIMDKVGSAICLLPEDNDISLICCLRGNVSESSLISSFKNVQQVCDDYHITSMIDTYTGTQTDPELAAISSLQKKLPSGISVTIRHCSLSDAINSICTGPIDERKALLLFLHNSEQPFSQMFSLSLKNEKVSAILRKHFLVIGWDVENTDYHDALKSALRVHTGLEYMSDFVSKKAAIASILLPVSNTISTFTCLRGNMTSKGLIENLKQVVIALTTAIKEENELIAIQNSKSSENDVSPEKMQKMWADMLGDRDYDAFYFNEHELLKQKIAFALGLSLTDTGYDSKSQEKIESLYEVIKEQSRLIAEFKDHIEIAFVFNCLVPLNGAKIKKAEKDPNYNPKSDFSPVPVFILRKCRNSEKPCRIIIDIDERVYSSWANYLTKNKHPECRMIFPRNGRYQVGDYILQEKMSPAYGFDVTALKVADGVASAAGLASGAIAITASIAALPVVAPSVLIGAGVAGVGAGVWAIGRSAYLLYDRATHSQTMSVKNSEARAAYLNLVAGTLGICGVGSNVLISQLVSRGVNIGQAGAFAANTIGVLNISAGGVSMINSGYELCDQLINGDQAPSTLVWLQFASSVLFFGHAVYSFKGAQTIIEETQTKVLQDYENSLRSNRHRKTFNKLVRQTMSDHSDGASGRAEVISTIRNIENKNEVFAALTRNQKRLTKSGIRYSAGDGEITFNGMAVDMNQFIGLNHKQSEIYLNNLAQDITSNQPSINSSSNINGDNVTLTNTVNSLLRTIQIDSSQVDISNLVRVVSNLLSFCNEPVKNMVVKAVDQSVKFIMKHLSEDIIKLIDTIIPKNNQLSEYFRIGISFFSQKVDEMEKNYEMFQKTSEEKYNNPLFRILSPVKVKRIVQIFEFIVQNSYSGKWLCEAVLNEMSKFISAWITRKVFEYTEKTEKEENRRKYSASYKPQIIDCNICGGQYFSDS
ncbi:uncharacterized protein LOC109540647 isoform X1 [Dendroctonus ponderosae]|uniref:uncharacterized protein LOC109540647 isoform X1 n=1 Tax=Dendroctonus ponderosae TaxID=77166 RepID=UPI0020361005|nr:uncharacterized protein LOC109540647 isoform X1 [Dendroctonus ponderosae]